jgi:hypothetical protein
MHKRAELNGLLVNLTNLTLGRQQQWLESQSPPNTPEEAQQQRRVRRLIFLSKEEESE